MRILEATLRLQWELMQEAIRRFQYFDHWSEEQVSWQHCPAVRVTRLASFNLLLSLIDFCCNFSVYRFANAASWPR